MEDRGMIRNTCPIVALLALLVACSCSDSDPDPGGEKKPVAKDVAAEGASADAVADSWRDAPAEALGEAGPEELPEESSDVGDPWAELCLPCAEDSECGAFGAACVVDSDRAGGFCAIPCESGGLCPDGYACSSHGGVTLCVPKSGTCQCVPGTEGTERPCSNENPFGICPGIEVCQGAAGWSDCSAPTPAEESCNDLDDDCDGTADEDWPDKGNACDDAGEDLCDNGQLACAKDGTGLVCVEEANKTESCNEVDDDCDGSIDEDWPDKGKPCDGDDEDLCEAGAYQCAADGLGLVCVDEAEEIEACNGMDDDCDGQLDEAGAAGCTPGWLDLDDDGHGAGDEVCLCSPEGLSQTGDDCDDTDSAVNPETLEDCLTSWDDNCDGEVNGEDSLNCADHYKDADSDGFGAGLAVCLCSPDEEYATQQDGDCDDSVATTFPGAPELCDLEDNDCDDSSDEEPWAVEGPMVLYAAPGPAVPYPPELGPPGAARLADGTFVVLATAKPAVGPGQAHAFRFDKDLSLLDGPVVATTLPAAGEGYTLSQGYMTRMVGDGGMNALASFVRVRANNFFWNCAWQGESEAMVAWLKGEADGKVSASAGTVNGSVPTTTCEWWTITITPPGIAWNGDQFLLAWEDQTAGPGKGYVRVAVAGVEGQVEGQKIPLENPDEAAAGMAESTYSFVRYSLPLIMAGQENAMVVWRKPGEPWVSRYLLMKPDFSAVVAGPFELALPEGSAWQMSGIRLDGEYMVAQQNAHGTSIIFWRVEETSGAVLGSLVHSNLGNQYLTGYPQLVPMGDGAGFALVQEAELQFGWVSRDFGIGPTITKIVKPSSGATAAAVVADSAAQAVLFWMNGATLEAARVGCPQ
jgi:hypothetical protein